MTADTSMMGGIGRVMGDAAQGAMLGHTIGQLKDEASSAIDLANDWHNYAKRLELKVAQLQATVQSVASTAREKIEEIADLEIERVKTNEKLAESQINRKTNFSTSEANEAYGKQFKFRLQQMEKALHHSSADKEGLRSILKAHQDVIERMNLTEQLPVDMTKNAETVRDKFMSRQDLTVESEVLAIIDKAPAPKRPLGATF